MKVGSKYCTTGYGEFIAIHSACAKWNGEKAQFTTDEPAKSHDWEL